jgi:hypothetical protein
MPRVDGPFWVTKRVNDNAYKVDLPGEYNVSDTFNIKNLSPYLEDVGDSNLRTNHFQLEGDDMHHDSNMEEANSNVYGHSDGLITRAQTSQLQSSLISQISATEAAMSLEACKLNENGSNMFVCFQKRLGVMI